MTKRELEEENAYLNGYVEDLKRLLDKSIDLCKDYKAMVRYNARPLKEILACVCEDEEYRDWLLNNPDFYAQVKTDILLNI